jgi:hypothetical protein
MYSLHTVQYKKNIQGAATKLILVATRDRYLLMY